MISTLKTRTLLMTAAVLLLATAATPAAAITQIFEVQVNAGENDAEEDSAGAVVLGDATLELGGLYRKVGLRFANITLAKNAPITRAYIEFTTADQDSTGTTFSIEAVAQDNPAVFTNALFNVSARPVYSQAVDWVMNYAWSTVDQAHQSADVTALVQKLVNRSGWASGNAMAFVISNGEDVFRKAKSWNADSAKAAKLHIEYAVNVVDVRVNSSMDDCTQVYYSPMSCNVDNTGRMYFGSNYYYPVLRFRDVNIPQGAVINYACLKFVAQADSPTTSGYIAHLRREAPEPPDLRDRHRGELALLPQSPGNSAEDRELHAVGRPPGLGDRPGVHLLRHQERGAGDRRPDGLGRERQVHGLPPEPHRRRHDGALRLDLRRRPRQGAAAAHRVRPEPGRGGDRPAGDHLERHRARPLGLRGGGRRGPALLRDEQRGDRR